MFFIIGKSLGISISNATKNTNLEQFSVLFSVFVTFALWVTFWD